MRKFLMCVAYTSEYPPTTSFLSQNAQRTHTIILRTMRWCVWCVCGISHWLSNVIDPTVGTVDISAVAAAISGASIKCETHFFLSLHRVVVMAYGWSKPVSSFSSKWNIFAANSLATGKSQFPLGFLKKIKMYTIFGWYNNVIEISADSNDDSHFRILCACTYTSTHW